MSFAILNGINVNENVEKKNGLSYLSWAWAWTRFCEVYPDATYDIEKNSDGIPLFGNNKMGYICYTSVTANGLTHRMWLPVMDGANKAMKDDPYTYEVAKWEWNNATKKKEKSGSEKKNVDAIDMFDVNKTVMRCLVKNLAMFGLGLYIYAGEDLPEDTAEQIADTPKQDIKPSKTPYKAPTQQATSKPVQTTATPTKQPVKPQRITPDQCIEVNDIFSEHGWDLKKAMRERWKIATLGEMTVEMYQAVLKQAAK
jgi:hypothetical protein